jgi:hypothetical protein
MCLIEDHDLRVRIKGVRTQGVKTLLKISAIAPRLHGDSDAGCYYRCEQELGEGLLATFERNMSESTPAHLFEIEYSRLHLGQKLKYLLCCIGYEDLVTVSQAQSCIAVRVRHERYATF